MRGEEFYAAFTPHVVRALAATYLLKVRARGCLGDALDEATRATIVARRPRVRAPAMLDEPTTAVAIRLLGDHEKTLHRRYVAWSRAMGQRLREPVDGWTHPAAYDRYLDRLLCGDRIDWAAEPDLPLPPTCTHDDLRVG